MPYMGGFSFTTPQQLQQQLQNPMQQQGMDQYQQQGQNLIDPGSTQLQQSDPYAMAGRQALGGAFQQAGQLGTPANQITWNGPRSDGSMSPDGMQQGMPMDADKMFGNQQQMALAQGLMQPQQSPWTMEANYPKPNFGGKQGVWGG